MTFKTYFRANLNTAMKELVLLEVLQSNVQVCEFDETAEIKDGAFFCLCEINSRVMANFVHNWFEEKSRNQPNNQSCSDQYLKAELEVQSCKLYNNKCLIAFTQITKNAIFAIIAVLVFKLLGRKVLFINRKDNRNC